MNTEISKIFYERARIVQNLDKIIKSSKKSKSNSGQFSLFDMVDEASVEVQLDEPEAFSPIEMAAAEKDALGFSMTYSPFEEYELVRCRYCDSNISDLQQDNEYIGNRTLLAEIRSIEYKVSQYGNNYAKIYWGDETGQERLYLSKATYRRLISKCFVGTIYLLTVTVKEDRSIDVLNFMPANMVNTKDICERVYVKCTEKMIPLLRMYTKVYMKGDEQDISLQISNLPITLESFDRVSVDNANLVAMRKSGFEVKLR